MIRAVAIAAGIGLLYSLPYASLSTPQLLILSLVMAIPIAAYRLEYRLFARRAVIEKASTGDGLGRRLLWNGGLVKLANGTLAVFLALFILVVSSALAPQEWLIMAGAMVVLLATEAASAAWVSRQASPEFRDIAQRGLSKWPVMLCIVAATATLFFNTGHPYYVDADPLQLAMDVFGKRQDEYASGLLGVVQGSLSAADAVTLYLAQNHIPRLDDSAAKWALWIYLAVKSSIAIGLVLYFIFGLLTLVSIQARLGWRMLGGTVFDRWFTATLVTLILAYAWVASITVSPAPAATQAAPFDCKALLDDVEGKYETRRRELEAEEKQLLDQTDSKIDSEVKHIFASAEAGVDRYLDWHYSVLGEYQQLGAQVIPTLESGAAARLAEYVYDNINDQLKTLGVELDEQIRAAVAESAGKRPITSAAESKFSSCLAGVELPGGSIDTGQVFVGHPQTALAGGAVAAVVMKKTAAKFTAKGVGKAAAKYGTSLATGLTAAGFCGPLAPACGVGVAVITWFAVDAAIVTADEILNRDELKAEIMAQLAEQEMETAVDLGGFYTKSIGRAYDQLEKQYRITRDGI